MKEILNEIRDELIKNFENGTLYEYIADTALSIEKKRNCLDYIMFTVGDPNIWLDINGERRGCVCGYWGTKEEWSVIPWITWEKIEDELIELFGELN